MRVFIGIMTPQLKDSLIRIQNEIKKLPLKAKFVEPENFHLTLSFLGEKSEFEIEKIKENLERICKDKRKFEIKIEELAPIPNERFIRVIAFKVESEEMEEIAREIKKLIGGDIKPPHLTLCRVKWIENKRKVVEKLKEIKLSKYLTIDSIQLIKSKLTPKGPIYSVLYSANLL